MMQRTFLLAAAVSLTLVPGRAESQAPDDVAMTLNCKTPSFKVSSPDLVVSGGCALPDGMMVKLNLGNAREMFASGQIIPTLQSAGSGIAELSGKKFSHSLSVDSPGKYIIDVRLEEDLQTKSLAAELKKRAGKRRTWQFEFLVWGDDLIGLLPPKVADLGHAMKEGRELSRRFEKASLTKTTWEAEKKELVNEGTKFMLRIDRLDVRTFFPAAANNLAFAVRTFVANAPYYTFDNDGKFSGASDYHADNKKVTTFRNEDFNWANINRYIDETATIAGREFSLWVIKDLRRTAGQMRGDIQEAIKSLKTHSGVDVFQERLLKATISDLDPLEAEIRGTEKK